MLQSIGCSQPATRNRRADTSDSHADRPVGISWSRLGNSAVESTDRGPCASGSLHGRGDDVVYYGAHGAVTGWTAAFTKKAMAIIYEQSKGIGWLINALCHQCLFAESVKRVLQIDDRLVRRIGQVI